MKRCCDCKNYEKDLNNSVISVTYHGKESVVVCDHSDPDSCICYKRIWWMFWREK